MFILKLIKSKKFKVQIIPKLLRLRYWWTWKEKGTSDFKSKNTNSLKLPFLVRLSLRDQSDELQFEAQPVALQWRIEFHRFHKSIHSFIHVDFWDCLRVSEARNNGVFFLVFSLPFLLQLLIPLVFPWRFVSESWCSNICHFQNFFLSERWPPILVVVHLRGSFRSCWFACVSVSVSAPVQSVVLWRFWYSPSVRTV